MNYTQMLLQLLGMMQSVTPVVGTTMQDIEEIYSKIVNHPDHPAGVALPPPLMVAAVPATPTGKAAIDPPPPPPAPVAP